MPQFPTHPTFRRYLAGQIHSHTATAEAQASLALYSLAFSRMEAERHLDNADAAIGAATEVLARMQKQHEAETDAQAKHLLSRALDVARLRIAAASLVTGDARLEVSNA